MNLHALQARPEKSYVAIGSFIALGGLEGPEARIAGFRDYVDNQRGGRIMSGASAVIEVSQGINSCVLEKRGLLGRK